jgi:hypothetical protein
MTDGPKDVNDLPFNEAMELYDRMRQAYYDGDEKELAELRKNYPSLFEEETANLLRTTAKHLTKLWGRNHNKKFTVH